MKTSLSLLRWLILIIGILSSIATNLADPPIDKAISSCERDEDCAKADATPYCLESYQICVECLDHQQCSAQQRCIDHRCLERCTSDAACPEGLVCTDGTCKGCEVDADCPDVSNYCYLGADFAACRPLCLQSLECAGPGYVDGDVCRGGRCQTVTCEQAADCIAEKETCDAGQCRPVL